MNIYEKALTIENENKFTRGEILLIRQQLRMNGSFYTELFNVIGIADSVNLQRLEKGFPSEVAAFREWRNGNLMRKIERITEA